MGGAALRVCRLHAEPLLAPQPLDSGPLALRGRVVGYGVAPMGSGATSHLTTWLVFLVLRTGITPRADGTTGRPGPPLALVLPLLCARSPLPLPGPFPCQDPHPALTRSRGAAAGSQRFCRLRGDGEGTETERETRTDRDRGRDPVASPAEYGSCFSGRVNSCRSYLARIHCSRRSLQREGTVSREPRTQLAEGGGTLPGPDSGAEGRSWGPVGTRPWKPRVRRVAANTGQKGCSFHF